MPISDFFRKSTSTRSNKEVKAYDHNTTEFVEALKNRDNEATVHLYQTMTRLFLPYAHQRSTISDEEADEILCEALAIGLANIIGGKYQFLGIPVTAYLFKIAKNQWLSYLKERDANVAFADESIAEDDDVDSTDRTTLSQEESSSNASYRLGQIIEPDDDPTLTDELWAEDSCKVKAVKRAKAELTPTCQEVVESYYYQNERLMDYSRRKGQNENYGRVLHHRCMEQFRKLAQQYYQQYLTNAKRIHR